MHFFIYDILCTTVIQRRSREKTTDWIRASRLLLCRWHSAKSSHRHGKAGLACVQEEENDQRYETKSCAVDGKGGQTPIFKVFGEKLGAEESRNT